MKTKSNKVSITNLKKQDNSKNIELTPLVKSIMGTFHVEKDFDYKKELSNKLAEKYD